VPDLVISGLRKTFGGVVALDDVSLAAGQGEVHALLGENGAGKTTLIKVLVGAHSPDAGSIELFGRPIRKFSPRYAASQGIAAVFQESALIPDLTVAENIWFRKQQGPPWRLLLGRKARAECAALFKHFGLDQSLIDRPVRDLSVAERQLVEIARALASEVKLLILDEATSALSQTDAAWLLRLVRKLAGEGLLVLYISHRLGEVREVADSVTILRNGRRVASHRMQEVDNESLISEVLGRKLNRLYPDKPVPGNGRTVLKVANLQCGERLKGVNFELYEGEILGLAGLQGQGQLELLLSLYGILKADGRVEVHGKSHRLGSPSQALSAGLGLALVPEDRQRQGLLLPKSVRENISLGVLDRLSFLGIIDRRAERRLVSQAAKEMQIGIRSLEQPVWTLSGGNQQKVLIAKVLQMGARILLIYDLARGVDVGTKAELFRLLRDLAESGYSILFYSSELEELIRVAQRILVMRDGRIAAVLQGAELTEEAILQVAMAG
jgi:ribose transport system ATP-binding protein